MTEPSKEARDAMSEATDARARIAEQAPRWRWLRGEVRRQNTANHYADLLAQALESTAQTPRRPSE